MINKLHMIQSATYALVASVTAVSLVMMAYFMAEPAISRAQAVDTAQFVISQTITDESSFLVDPANVTMNGSLNGISGGTANGSTTFSVQSNNSSGYTVQISFEDNTTENAMLGGSTADESIRDYDEASPGTPDFAFNASTSAQFGYTVESVNLADTDPAFIFDGGNICDNGGAATNQGDSNCWKAPTTTGFQIINRTSAAPTGATSTIHFRVVVPSNPNPVPAAETYYATATLSLFNN